MTEHDLDQVRVVGILAIGKGRRHRRHIGPRGGVEELDSGVDDVRLDLGLVALDVHDDIGSGQTDVGQLGGDLGKAARAVGMVFTGEDRGSAGGLDGGDDARVVRSHHDGIERTSFARLFEDMHNQRLASLGGENLLGKAAGSEARRNDADRAHTRRVHVGSSFMSRSISLRRARMSR